MSWRRDAVIVDAVRTGTGRGKPGGALAEVHPVDLLSEVFSALIRRNGIDPGSVDDVVIGCVSQVGEQSATPGRMAWLAAGLPAHVPATTVDRKCGSGQQAIHFAAQGIAAGVYDMVIAGGVESMSRVRMGSARAGADPDGVGVAERFAPGLVPQGVAADLVAHRWGITRAELDGYAVRSHRLAAASAAMRREIIGVPTPTGLFERDETVRPDTTETALAQLPSAFRSDEMAARFSEMSWGTTAGNSSQLADSAGALLLMSLETAERLGLTPRARLHTMLAVGDDPLLMLTAPIPATHGILRRSGLSMADIDHVEINEAFASVPLAWMREFDIDLVRVNPRGGAIALGHPLGASGARLMTTMLHALEDNDQRFGLQLMCEAGGMANATILERLSDRQPL
ncbi:thiolase family protein [Nocardia brevicatena]|uniref:thiolase family protein n=1 Tax=Nocardia brevicatena TaxID=37327 RepID=UPI0002DC4A26|nr:thiolase family protein [Nocardia brevicatena]